MENLATKIKDWYKGLPKWAKIVAPLVLIALVILFILQFLSGTSGGLLENVDKLHKKQVDDELDELDEETKVIKKSINKKKEEIATKLNQAGKIDAKTVENREKIMKAETMEELDRLQKELGL